MVVLISGKQGSGKTTTADGLAYALEQEGYCVYRKRFAQPLYDMHDAVLSVLAGYGIVRKLKKDGDLLQLLGTDYGRKSHGEDVWIRCLKNWYDKALKALGALKARVGRPTNDVVPVLIVDDLRFQNEFVAFEDAICVRLECPKEIRKTRCSQWRENDTHQSEVDLDGWLDKFDLVVHTDVAPLPVVINTIKELVRHDRTFRGPGPEARK